MIDERNMVVITGVADNVILKLCLVTGEGLHRHDARLHLAIQSTIVSIEPVHTSGNVDDEFQTLRLQLRCANFRLFLRPSSINCSFAGQALDQFRIVKLAGSLMPQPLSLFALRL